MTIAGAGISPDGTGSPPPAMEDIVSLKNLRVEFDRDGRVVHALRGVSLNIRHGEILTLVGESGSGKSVLGSTILGLVMENDPPARVSGHARVFGVDIVGSDREARRRLREKHLGAVFQDPMTSLNPTMRIGGQLMEVSTSTEGAVESLSHAGIPDARARLRSFPHQLSGGLRQRVMIAMSIASAPGLIVADEPTTALDVTVQAQVLTHLRLLRDETGTSVLMITHDMAVAAQLADRIAVMYAGNIVEIGRAHDVLHSPRHPYTAGLLESRIDMTTPTDRPIRTLAGEVPSPYAPAVGCAYAPRCPRAQQRCRDEAPELRADAEHKTAVACHFPIETNALRALSAIEPQTVAERAHLPAGNAAESSPAVRCVGISVAFGHRTALDDVSVEIADGEAVAIVGESGCGKSTLLRVIAGLQRPRSGSVELSAPRPQMVFQDAGSSLTPWMSVGEIIGEQLPRRLPRAERSRRIAESLDRVGLASEVARLRAGTLSGGQRQRVAIARVIVMPPRLLLADEPTSALDPSLAAVALNLLTELRRELGMALVFVTHDLAAARYVGDRIMVMDAGRIIESGTSASVIEHPSHERTRALLRAVPSIRAERTLS